MMNLYLCSFPEACGPEQYCGEYVSGYKIVTLEMIYVFFIDHADNELALCIIWCNSKFK